MPDGFDRAWLLTWTTYGSWLPGDDRGFVSNVRDRRPGTIEPPGIRRHRHNTVGSDYDRAMDGLYRSSLETLTGTPIRLTAEQAVSVSAQLRETAQFRGWTLLCTAVMANHVHLVVGVPGDPDPATVLRDFKSYASRALNAMSTKPPSGRWWTESGSRRVLRDPKAILGAIRYVREQEYPLRIWVAPVVDTWT